MAQFNRKILKQIYCQRALAGDSVVAKLFEQRLVIGGANNADSVCGIKAKRDIGAPPEIALQRRNPLDTNRSKLKLWHQHIHQTLN